jgi:hypothetical protein
MSDFAVVCWLWSDGNRVYRPEHVRVLASMCKRHMGKPHRFICITDDPGDYGPDVEIVPTPEPAFALAHLRTLEGARFPSCYRRLWLFSREAQALASRVLLLDVDTLVMGDCTPLIDRPEPFVGWRPLASWGGRNRLGGGMYLMDTGAHPEVWEDFSPTKSPAKVLKAGFRGSDQAWISYKLFGKVPTWGDDAGIYSVRDIKRTGEPPPPGARIVHFNGKTKPWSPDAGAWVAKLWH